MKKLDPGNWLRSPGLRAILEALGAKEARVRLVGGAVRDTMLGLTTQDIDLATTLAPEQVVAALQNAGLKAVPTGLAHGTVTAVVKGHGYEVTTLRQDLATDGRHAEVAFTDDWQADAARRDFTINALYADPFDGTLYDYFGGIEDLAERRVRFIGNPLQRIAEDHLRILRFFRFTARFSQQFDEEGLEASTERANDLMALSRERIREELLRTLVQPAVFMVLQTMLARNILMPVLPEITVDHLEDFRSLMAAEEQAVIPPNPIRRLAALLPADPELAANIANRLRLSKVERKRLCDAANRTPAPSDPRALAYKLGAEAALDRLLLTNDPRATTWAGPFADWPRPRLPISGKDLIEMGLPPGPQVSKTLAQVEESWIAAGFPNDREKTRKMARAILGIR